MFEIFLTYICRSGRIRTTVYGFVIIYQFLNI